VEGLRGVAVLAATSRPDLVDAALLRPGRLDRLEFCGLPDKLAPLQILHALTRRLPLADGVDLGWLAGRSAELTGADLSAVLSEAMSLQGHHRIDYSRISNRFRCGTCPAALDAVCPLSAVRCTCLYSSSRYTSGPLRQGHATAPAEHTPAATRAPLLTPGRVTACRCHITTANRSPPPPLPLHALLQTTLAESLRQHHRR
jgi:SpoVK/Ycf46/Vps4 family AAA+-type ATPase